MNYLLFFITSVFSFIFYIFYKLNNGENIFGNNLFQAKNFSSLSGNLFIESFIFLFLAFFIFLYFSNNYFSNKLFRRHKQIKNKLEISKLEKGEGEGKLDKLEKKLNKEKNTEKIKFFIFNISEKNIFLIRAISFIILYIFIIFGIFFLYNNFGNLETNILYNLFGNNKNILENIFSVKTLYFLLYLLAYIFLIITIFINFNIHKKFQNYISLFFSIITFVFILNYLLKIIFSSFLFGYNTVDIIKSQLILNVTVPFFIIIFTYLYKQKYLFDYIFLHCCAFFVNILGIIYYFINSDFSFYKLGIIILLNIALFLLSYFKLKKC